MLHEVMVKIGHCLKIGNRQTVARRVESGKGDFRHKKWNNPEKSGEIERALNANWDIRTSVPSLVSVQKQNNSLGGSFLQAHL